MNVKRKLLVTGANGFVAGSVLGQAGAEWELHTVSRGEPARGIEAANWHRCDPLKRGELSKTFAKAKPDMVIHTAAIADIDLAQQNQQLARAVNVDFTRGIVDLCKETDCRLVFCSTDTVFDGEHAPYSEDDPAHPVNYYGQTKLEAEEIVGSLGRRAVIARLALVVGLPVLGFGNSFLARMLAAFKEGRALKAPEEEVRTPVDVITVGRALLELAVNDMHGMLHLAGNDRLNRIEMGKRIATRLGFSPDLIVPQTAAEFPERARRPRDVSLDNTKARSQLKTPMRSFDEAFSLILS